VQRQERENANAARAVRRQQEIAAPGADLQLANVGQVNANPTQQALVAPAGPQQRCHDDPPRANRLRARDVLRDLEHDGLDVYNSPQTNLGAALAVLTAKLVWRAVAPSDRAACPRAGFPFFIFFLNFFFQQFFLYTSYVYNSSLWKKLCTQIEVYRKIMHTSCC
jgi:hypothetical protein